VKLIRKYDYPSSTRASIEGLRHYNVDGSTERLPSVTTVLGETQEQSKRDSLQRWRQRVGVEEAKKITHAAATRGTSMHMYLEKYCLGEGYLDLTDTGNVANIWQNASWTAGLITDLQRYTVMRLRFTIQDYMLVVSI